MEKADQIDMKITPLNSSLPLRNASFDTLVEALEYAAEGETGYNFYDGRGELSSVLSYKDLRVQAKCLARKLVGLGLKRGARVAIVAETDPAFQILLCLPICRLYPSCFTRGVSDRCSESLR